jgi:hypothetical protein
MPLERGAPCGSGKISDRRVGVVAAYVATLGIEVGLAAQRIRGRLRIETAEGPYNF